jgi:Yip1 domain
MDASAPSARTRARVVNIVTRPRLEWPAIAAEPRDVAGLYRGYIAPLAAIPVICRLIGMSLVGISVPYLGYYRISIGAAAANAVVQYVLGLVGIYVAALVITKLAPTFQSTPDTAQALKLVGYSMTPVWIAGVLHLVPALSPLVLLAALYSIYVCHVGIAPVMETPADKVTAYLVASAIVLIAVYMVIALLMAALMPLAFIAPRPAM